MLQYIDIHKLMTEFTQVPEIQFVLSDFAPKTKPDVLSEKFNSNPTSGVSKR